MSVSKTGQNITLPRNGHRGIRTAASRMSRKHWVRRRNFRFLDIDLRNCGIASSSRTTGYPVNRKACPAGKERIEKNGSLKLLVI